MRRAAYRAALAIACAVGLWGCPGPPGPPGPEGPAGPPGAGGAVLLLTATANVSDASLVRYGMFARENQPENREDSVLFSLPRGGTLRSFFVAPSSALESAGAVIEITVRINQADTALSFTHTQADGSATLSDTTTLVPVAAGDRISVRFRETAGVDPITTAGIFAHYNVTLELH